MAIPEYITADARSAVACSGGAPQAIGAGSPAPPAPARPFGNVKPCRAPSPVRPTAAQAIGAFRDSEETDNLWPIISSDLPRGYFDLNQSDRTVYLTWSRRVVFFYIIVVALLIASILQRSFVPTPSVDIVGDLRTPARDTEREK